MQSKDKLKKVDVKNRPCYNFDNIIRASDRNIDINLLVFFQTKNYINKKMKIFEVMIFLIKLQGVQNHCVLGTVRQMDLLKFLMELDVQY